MDGWKGQHGWTHEMNILAGSGGVDWLTGSQERGALLKKKTYTMPGLCSGRRLMGEFSFDLFLRYETGFSLSSLSSYSLAITL